MTFGKKKLHKVNSTAEDKTYFKSSEEIIENDDELNIVNEDVLENWKQKMES